MSHILDNFEALPKHKMQTPKPYPELLGFDNETNHRIAYRFTFLEPWKYRYFNTDGQAYQAKKELYKLGYMVFKQYRHADGNWIG